VEAVARQLLARYGVVFHRLLLREDGLPPYRELLKVYRRLEARGEIRGGRFVAGFSGEQYALPEAVQQVRAARRSPADGMHIVISAADPLNLVGITSPAQRVPAIASNRVVYCDGVPVAAHIGKEAHSLLPSEPAPSAEARQALAASTHKGGLR
jgi:ATP-dependent Lhr-like helicase